VISSDCSQKNGVPEPDTPAVFAGGYILLNPHLSIDADAVLIPQ